MPSGAVSSGHSESREKDCLKEGVESFTILLAAHNRLGFLKESLGSVLQQEPKGFQVVVVDDGSDSETREWLREQSELEPCLQVVFAEHQGVAQARQRGLEESGTPWVCILDSDDLLLPGAIKYLADSVGESPEVDFFYVDNRHLLPDGSWEDRSYPQYQSNAAMRRAVFIRPRIPFKHSGTTMKRDTALQIGGYDRSLAIKVDIDLLLRFLSKGLSVKLIPEPLVAFRVHRRSMSSNRFEGIRAWKRLIWKYGPSSSLLKLTFFCWRTGVECAKLAYLYFRLPLAK
tara:strand:+ start:683 stop:1543 length:861 start_codon:yes stop_codon:yes gene_type:complete